MRYTLVVEERTFSGKGIGKAGGMSFDMRVGVLGQENLICGFAHKDNDTG